MLKTIIIASTLFVVLVESKSLIVGEVYEQSGTVSKVFNQTFEIPGTPSTITTQTIQFNFEEDHKIKGIAIKDLDDGLAEPAIASGGLGFNYVDINLQSEKGAGFKYLVEIYA